LCTAIEDSIAVSARRGAARRGSARLGAARLGAARLGAARLGSARLGVVSARFLCGVGAVSVPVRRSQHRRYRIQLAAGTGAARMATSRQS